MKYGDVSFRVLRIVCFMDPCIDYVCSWMAVQIEDLDNSIPNRFALKGLLYRHTFQVLRMSLMQMADHAFEFHDMCRNHLAASSNSPTLQNEPVTPAAIAGVHLRVLCLLTKL